jgi:hypothetical protein
MTLSLLFELYRILHHHLELMDLLVLEGKIRSRISGVRWRLAEKRIRNCATGVKKEVAGVQ